MADQADERLKALNASMKEALGKLTGSDELEAQGVHERTASRAGPKANAPARPASKARTAPAPKSATGSRTAKIRTRTKA